MILYHREIRLNTRTVEYERNCIEYNGNRYKEGEKSKGKEKKDPKQLRQNKHITFDCCAVQNK